MSDPLPPLPPHELRPFLHGVQADPDDDLAIRALGDWLEEVGDVRAELVRAGLVWDVTAVKRWVKQYGEAWWGQLPQGVRLEVRRGLIELVWPTRLLTAEKPNLSPGLLEMLEQGWVFCVVLDGPAEHLMADWAADVLQHVTAIRWERATDAGLGRLPPLPLLRELDLGKSAAVSSAALPLLARYPGLWRLRLSGCEGLTAVSLAGFSELRQLRLAWNLRMTSVSLASLPELRALSMAMSDQFDTLQLSNVPQVREVLLRGCVQLTSSDLAPLASLEMLETLDLTGCVRLDLGTGNRLRNLPQLRELILNGCTGLERLRLTNLPSLRVLDLAETHVTHLGLAGVPALEQLDLHGHRLGTRLRSLEDVVPQSCRVRL